MLRPFLAKSRAAEVSFWHRCSAAVGGCDICMTCTGRDCFVTTSDGDARCQNIGSGERLGGPCRYPRRPDRATERAKEEAGPVPPVRRRLPRPGDGGAAGGGGP